VEATVVVRCTPIPEAWLVFLVNEFGSGPRRVAGEGDSAYPAVDDVVGCPPEARSCRTGRLAAIADQLHPVFMAASEDERTDRLNAVLRATRVAMQSDPGQPGGVAWLVTGTASERLLTVAALTVLELLRDGRRLGHCEAQDCVDVYVSGGSGRPRAFCSDGCQSRHKVRAYRMRRRLSTPPAGRRNRGVD
jgi:CGNR zinc finger